jgi:hypothetical protein
MNFSDTEHFFASLFTLLLISSGIFAIKTGALFMSGFLEDVKGLAVSSASTQSLCPTSNTQD